MIVSVKRATADGPVAVSTTPVGAQSTSSVPLHVAGAYVGLVSTDSVIVQLAAKLAGRTEVTFLLPMS